MKNIIQLENAKDLQAFGNKAVALAKLKEIQVLIPNGVVIPVEFFWEFMEHNNLCYDMISNIESPEGEVYKKIVDALDNGVW